MDVDLVLGYIDMEKLKRVNQPGIHYSRFSPTYFYHFLAKITAS